MTATVPARRVGIVAAVGIGVGSMLGAGVFSRMWVDVLGAGGWYLAAITLAGAVALANALSTAQLASRYPVAGGAYAYGREELGPFAGHVAGVAFVVGKTLSVSVGALVLGAYVVPGHQQGFATAAIVVAWAFNARGITKTAAGATAIAIVVAAALVALVVAASIRDTALDSPVLPQLAVGSPVPAFLTATAAAFFAFAGYARIATLGEEVRAPAKTIPRAIVTALGVVVVLYVAVGWALDAYVGRDRLGVAGGTGDSIETAGSITPIAQLATAAGLPAWPVTVVAALAVFGAMLAVMAGAGRTAMAMARNRDLPGVLARQGASGAPWRAEAVVAIGALALVWTQGANLLLVSVASVLTYYAVANLAAIRQRRAARTAGLSVPVAVSAFGLVASAGLAAAIAPHAAGAAGPLAVLVALVIGWPAATAVLRRRARPGRRE